MKWGEVEVATKTLITATVELDTKDGFVGNDDDDPDAV